MDKAVYIPNVYTQMQNAWTDSFLASSGYLGKLKDCVMSQYCVVKECIKMIPCYYTQLLTVVELCTFSHVCCVCVSNHLLLMSVLI